VIIACILKTYDIALQHLFAPWDASGAIKKEPTKKLF